MSELNGKIALISGGSRGIGEAIVRKFHEEGATVAFTYRSSSERANALAADLGERVHAFQSNASSFEETGELVKEVVDQFGQLDVLVNNAGITQDNLLLRMSEDQWDSVLQVNLKSVFNFTKHAIRSMMRQRSGSIINMSSVVGVSGNAGQANYAASKAGIIGFSKSVAKEVGSRGIRCNSIAPGFIQTEMTDRLDDKTRDMFLANIPMNRWGAPEEVADVCVFLGSDRSKYVSGQTIHVCGGMNT